MPIIKQALRTEDPPEMIIDDCFSINEASPQCNISLKNPLCLHHQNTEMIFQCQMGNLMCKYKHNPKRMINIFTKVRYFCIKLITKIRTTTKQRITKKEVIYDPSKKTVTCPQYPEFQLKFHDPSIMINEILLIAFFVYLVNQFIDNEGCIKRHMISNKHKPYIPNNISTLSYDCLAGLFSTKTTNNQFRTISFRKNNLHIFYFMSRPQSKLDPITSKNINIGYNPLRQIEKYSSLAKFILWQIHNQEHSPLFSYNITKQMAILTTRQWFIPGARKFLKTISKTCSKCSQSRLMQTNKKQTVLTPELGATFNLTTLGNPLINNQEIMVIDLVGPYRILSHINPFSTNKETTKIWILITCRPLIGWYSLHILPSLTAESLFISLSTIILTEGKTRFIYSDDATSSEHLANKICNQSNTINNESTLLSKTWKTLLNDKYKRKFSLLDSSLFIFASNRHSGVSVAERAVFRFKNYLLQNHLTQVYKHGELNYFHLQYLNGIFTRAINSLPLFQYENKLITPYHLRSLSGLGGDISLTSKETGRDSKAAHSHLIRGFILNMEKIISQIYDTLLNEQLYQYLQDSKGNLYTSYYGTKSIHLRINDYVIDRLSFQTNGNFLHAIFKIICLDTHFCIISQPHYNQLTKVEVGSAKYKSLINHPLVVSRQYCDIIFLFPASHLQDNTYSPLNDNYDPFKIAQLNNLITKQGHQRKIGEPSLQTLIIDHLSIDLYLNTNRIKMEILQQGHLCSKTNHTFESLTSFKPKFPKQEWQEITKDITFPKDTLNNQENSKKPKTLIIQNKQQTEPFRYNLRNKKT